MIANSLVSGSSPGQPIKFLALWHMDQETECVLCKAGTGVGRGVPADTGVNHLAGNGIVRQLFFQQTYPALVYRQAIRGTQAVTDNQQASGAC